MRNGSTQTILLTLRVAHSQISQIRDWRIWCPSRTNSPRAKAHWMGYWGVFKATKKETGETASPQQSKSLELKHKTIRLLCEDSKKGNRKHNSRVFCLPVFSLRTNGICTPVQAFAGNWLIEDKRSHRLSTLLRAIQKIIIRENKMLTDEGK